MFTPKNSSITRADVRLIWPEGSEALNSYRGALIIVSHDDAFLARLGLDVVLALSESGALIET